MTQRGFTLIEAMVVLLIIGMLTVIGAIGYGKVSRQKKLQMAAIRISDEVAATRDYSIFGKDINGNYPCGYGIFFKAGSASIKEIYTSGAGFDRVSAMEGNETCDEKISGQSVAISENQIQNDNLVLTATIKGLYDFINNSNGNRDCIVVLYSASRGRPYYCTPNNCALNGSINCTFQAFSDSAIPQANVIKAGLLLQEGSASEGTCVNIFPSGNSQVESDVPVESKIPQCN